MEQRTLIAFDRYKSTLLVMSFMSELTMMMTSSDPGPTLQNIRVRQKKISVLIAARASETGGGEILCSSNSLEHNNIYMWNYLFDDKVHHPPQIGIFCLEQLCDAEENFCGFCLHKTKHSHCQIFLGRDFGNLANLFFYDK